MKTTTSSTPWCENKKRRTMQLSYWTLAWLFSFALASFGPKLLWPDSTMLSWISMVINLLLGVGVVFANIRQLRSVDELERKISLEAMGITLGAGFVVGFGAKLLHFGNLSSYRMEAWELITFMSIVLMVSVLIGTRRHQ